MVLSAHQPGYLPWLGFFHKMAIADMFVFYDHVQYVPKHTDNRNFIKFLDKRQVLTIPCYRKGHYNVRLCDTVILDRYWRQKHSKTICAAYKKAPHFDAVWEKIRPIYEQECYGLSALNVSLIKVFMEIMGIKTPTLHSSDMGIGRFKHRGVLDMCVAVGATTYIFGKNGRQYMGPEEIQEFNEKNIDVKFQDYHHPAYPQVNGEFMSHLSVLDLLMNVPHDECLGVLLSGNAKSANEMAGF